MEPDLWHQTEDSKSFLYNSDLGITGWLAEVRGLRSDAAFLLQYDLIAFLQPAQNFCLRAVGDPNVDRHLILAFLTLRIGNLNRRLLVLVVENRAFRDLQIILVLVQDDFRVRGHLGLEFAA